MKYSSEDIRLNKKLKEEEIEELNLAGGENSDPDTLMGESKGIDYEKLANMIVEKMAGKNVITEDDKQEDKDSDNEKNVDKSKKSKKKKKNEEE